MVATLVKILKELFPYLISVIWDHFKRLKKKKKIQGDVNEAISKEDRKNAAAKLNDIFRR